MAIGATHKHCPTHDVSYGKLEQCPQCRKPVGFDVTANEIAEVPSGCTDSAEHERRFTELADFADESGRKMLDSERVNHYAVAAVLNVAIKARAQATALAVKRERKARIDAREKRLASRSKGRN